MLEVVTWNNGLMVRGEGLRQYMSYYDDGEWQGPLTPNEAT
jgi:hypothetical protein